MSDRPKDSRDASDVCPSNPEERFTNRCRAIICLTFLSLRMVRPSLSFKNSVESSRHVG